MAPESATQAPASEVARYEHRPGHQLRSPTADISAGIRSDLTTNEPNFERDSQYFWVTLLDPSTRGREGPRRHISVVTSPNERGVLGLCTRLRDSAFKRSLAELPIGAEVEVEEPKGDFLLPDAQALESLSIQALLAIRAAEVRHAAMVARPVGSAPA